MPLKTITSESTNRISMLLIGTAGIGKTSTIKTIPQEERACVLSAEGGLLSVRDLVIAGRVEGFEIYSLADMREAFQLLKDNEGFRERYRWVFIDSLSEISSRCVEAMKAKYPSRSDTYALWNDYTDTMTLLIKGFRDLQNYNVVFTCLDSIEKDEDNRRFVGTAIAGTQLKERLTSYFDEVFYMTAFKNEDGSGMCGRVDFGNRKYGRAKRRLLLGSKR